MIYLVTSNGLYWNEVFEKWTYRYNATEFLSKNHAYNSMRTFGIEGEIVQKVAE